MLVYERLEHSLMDKTLSCIREYTKDDLTNAETIRIICNNYCAQYLQITKSGWKFLIEYYGYEKLYEIDKSCNSGFYHWYGSENSDNSFEAYKKWISERIENYRNVPDRVHIDHRPESIARSALCVGKTIEEVAELFELPLDYVQKIKEQI